MRASLEVFEKNRNVAAITTSTSASEAPKEYIEMNNKNLHQHERVARLSCSAPEETDRRRVRPFCSCLSVLIIDQ